MGDNIILIGMPSSGKSTAGILLAQTVGYGFLDTDLLIESERRALLSEIIEREGAEGFIAIEDFTVARLWARRCVIATGGSVVYGENAMNNLRSLGKTVYLHLSLGEVERRLGNFEKRGVVMKGSVSTLAGLYAQRAPYYKKYADFTLECDGKSVGDTVAELAAVVRSITGA